jgi:hypothetical protein
MFLASSSSSSSEAPVRRTAAARSSGSSDGVSASIEAGVSLGSRTAGNRGARGPRSRRRCSSPLLAPAGGGELPVGVAGGGADSFDGLVIGQLSPRLDSPRYLRLREHPWHSRRAASQRSARRPRRSAIVRSASRGSSLTSCRRRGAMAAFAGGRQARREFNREFIRPIDLRLQRWRRHPRR